MERTFDKDYITGLASRPGIRKTCISKFSSVPDMRSVEESVVDEKTHFLRFTDGDRDLGIVVLVPERDLGYQLHLCLRTIKNATIEAGRMVIEYCKEIGIKSLYAIYDSGKRGADHFTEFFGFKQLGTAFHGEVVIKILNITPCLG